MAKLEIEVAAAWKSIESGTGAENAARKDHLIRALHMLRRCIPRKVDLLE